MHTVFQIVLVLFQLLLGEFFEACQSPVALAVDEVLLLRQLEILYLLVVVFLKECSLGEAVGGSSARVELFTRLGILEPRILGFVFLAGLFVEFGSLLEMHRCAQVIRRPFEQASRDGRLSLLETLIRFLDFIFVFHVLFY